MNGKKRLSPRARKALAVAAAIETVLKALMLADLRRRPASQVRGSKRWWTATTLLGTAGIAPLTYFLVGRRPGPGG